MGKTRLGFDIGSSSLKVAVLRGHEVRIEEERLPENMVGADGQVALPHAFSQFLRQVRKGRSLPHAAATLVLPPGQAICRLVTVPRMTHEQVMVNLPYEFADFIQGAAGQYHCDYVPCGPDGPGGGGTEGGQDMELMAAAAPKALLAGYAQMFRRAGVRLTCVLPQEMALVQLFQARGGDAGEVCFVDLGHQSTRIAVVCRGRVQATRQIALGGRSIDAIVAGEMGVSPFLSNTYKVTDFQGVLSLPAVAELCERIAVEVLKVVNFYQFTYRPSALGGICLVGGGAALPLLGEAIRRTVGLPLVDPASLLPGAGQAAAVGAFAAGAVVGVAG